MTITCSDPAATRKEHNMARRGPIPGTTGRNPAEVAAVARHALAAHVPVAATVAERFGCTLAAAKCAVSRARKAGHHIPYDYYTVNASPERYEQWRRAVARGNAARDRKAADRRALVAATVVAAKADGAPVLAAVATALGVKAAAAAGAIRQARKHDTPDMPPSRVRRPTPAVVLGWVAPEARHATPLACDCGQPADTIDALTRHTLAAHHRAPTRTERTPRRNEVAA